MSQKLTGKVEQGPGCNQCGATGESVEAWNRRPTVQPSASPLTPYGEALRAVQNCLLVVPEGKFRDDMSRWLDEKLGITDPTTNGGTNG